MGEPSLSEIIQAKAIELNLGASWKAVEPRLSYKPLLLQGWLRWHFSAYPTLLRGYVFGSFPDIK